MVSQENPGISHKSTRFLSDKMPKPGTCFGKKGLKALSGMPSAFMQQALDRISAYTLMLNLHEPAYRLSFQRCNQNVLLSNTFCSEFASANFWEKMSIYT
ncbi:MAG: hypothetical protein F6K65_08525 [Moorea sp. SIO3C2]|nr:hypothetical protein [Moorena sp. SIO3C2]